MVENISKGGPEASQAAPFTLSRFESRQRIRQIAREGKSGALLNTQTIAQAQEDLIDTNLNPALRRSLQRIQRFHEVLHQEDLAAIRDGDTISIDYVGQVVLLKKKVR